jgi:hypothetical protein
MTAEQLPGTPHQPQVPHDPQLTLAGVSRDGQRLLLVSRTGAEYVLPVDARLTAALRGDTSRLGQLEITMDSTLRPRDIQSRIRAGETPETVAKAASTTVERIMPYAAPVLAEREHITQRAQRSSLRRTGTTTRTLGDAVGAHLRGLDVDPEQVAWDAWRREDGRWTLVAKFAVASRGDQPGRKGTGTFTFDAPGNFVVVEDDHAQWLVGDAPAPVEAAPAPTSPADARRGLSAVPAAPSSDDTWEQPVEAFLDTTAPSDPDVERAEHEHAAESADAQALDDDRQAPPADDESRPRRAVRKKGGRASVPTWDEIMFGGGKQD